MSAANLIDDVALAAQLDLPFDKFHQLRRDNKWPCVKFGRNVYRFTPDHVAQIIALQTRGVERGTATEVKSFGSTSGLTTRSAKGGKR